MRLTLIRHGIAGDAPRDEERALTERGRIESRRVGRALDRQGVGFDLIVSSPLVRAVQTAEIVAFATGHRGPLVVDRSLCPEAPTAGVVALLRTLGSPRHVALVAHEPILSGLAARLTGRPGFRALEKSEAVRIRLDDGLGDRGVVRWSIDPKTGKRREKAEG